MSRFIEHSINLDTVKHSHDDLHFRTEGVCWGDACAMKNASMIWGGVFVYLNKLRKNYLLHPTSSGFESHAIHMQTTETGGKTSQSFPFPYFITGNDIWSRMTEARVKTGHMGYERGWKVYWNASLFNHKSPCVNITLHTLYASYLF